VKNLSSGATGGECSAIDAIPILRRREILHGVA
jgi:hypothetical protein